MISYGPSHSSSARTTHHRANITLTPASPEPLASPKLSSAPKLGKKSTNLGAVSIKDVKGTADSSALEKTLQDITTFTKKATPDETIRLEVPITIFQQIESQVDAGLFPQWNNLKIDYNGSHLFIRRPSYLHEVLPPLLARMKEDLLLPNISFGQGKNKIRMRGTGDITFYDGISKKCPDEGLFDAENQDKLGHYPTVVFEVGVSESAAGLALDACRHLGGSNYAIQLVVTLKIETSDKTVSEDDVTYLERKIKTINCRFWEVTKSQSVVKGTAGSTNEPRLINPNLDIYEYVVPGPASTLKDRKLTITKTVEHKIMTNHVLCGDGFVSIKFSQLFRKVPPQEKPKSAAISIPFSLLHSILVDHLATDNVGRAHKAKQKRRAPQEWEDDDARIEKRIREQGFEDIN